MTYKKTKDDDSESFYGYHDSPVGPLLLVIDALGLQHVHMDSAPDVAVQPNWSAECGQLDEVRRQLDGYFAGTRQSFDLPLNLRGTDFQRAVWRALCEIPFGQTASYAQIAKALARPKAVRAVGAANGANPVSIIVPCHRVIGSNGSLTGYASGLPRKQQLLQWEGAWPVQASLF